MNGEFRESVRKAPRDILQSFSFRWAPTEGSKQMACPFDTSGSGRKLGRPGAPYASFEQVNQGRDQARPSSRNEELPGFPS